MVQNVDLLSAARAEALFVSCLSAWADPTKVEVSTAIRDAVHRYGGVRACAEEVAAAYGDHPETAAPRMRWARDVVRAMYSPRSVGTSEPSLQHVVREGRRIIHRYDLAGYTA